MNSAEMWQQFCEASNSPEPELAGYEECGFCDNQSDADTLAELVRIGRKTGTCSCLWEYEHNREPLPQAGSYRVVIDWAGQAVCVIRIMAVEIVPYDRITAEFAWSEGEGDQSMRYWQEAHWSWFARTLPEIGRVAVPEMPLVCETFARVFPI